MIKELENLSKSELIVLLKDEQDRNTDLEQEKEKHKQETEKHKQEAGWLKHQIAQLQRLLFGVKKERFIPSPNQIMLPFDVEEQVGLVDNQQKIEYTRKKVSQDNHPGRNALPSHLPVEEITIEPKEDTEGLVKIGEEITDELEYKAAELYVKRYIRPKYSLGKEKGVTIAELPTRPIDKCIAGSGLLSQILIDKFVDHLPIYRQIERWKRWDAKLSSSTINSWQESVCRLLDPLYETLKHQVLSEGYLQVDETPIKVLDKQKKGKLHQGYHWVYHSPIQKVVFFDYRKGRSREGPKEMLKDFQGYLQTDGYSAYNWFKDKEGITMLSCMAHTRRYFEQALDNDHARAEYALRMIQQLYAIERETKDLSAKERHEIRLEKSLPIINQLGKWIAQEHKKVIPKSAIGKAFGYAVIY